MAQKQKATEAAGASPTTRLVNLLVLGPTRTPKKKETKKVNKN
jgi:hypothetical protein